MPDLILEPFALNGDKTVPPQTDSSNFVNFDLGYTSDYEIDLASGNPAAKAVERRIQNYLFYLLTSNVKDFQMHGLPLWQASMPGGYDINAIVMRYDGTKYNPWRSLVATNSVDPNAVGQTSWEYVQSIGQIIQNIPMPAGGPGGYTQELITTATDLNTLTASGTYEFKTDAIAAASAHLPLNSSGAQMLAGMLEVKTWTYSTGQTYTLQRYLDRLGNAAYRGAATGSFLPWTNINALSNFSADTSTTANLIEGSQYMPAGLYDNQQFWVSIANANGGACMFTPNPAVVVTPLPLVGAAGLPLQGGELVALGRALIIYRADITSFVLISCTGGAQQGVAAANSNQFVTLGQAGQLFNPALTYFIGQF